MLNAQSADKVLRSVYLDVIVDQINTTSTPFYNMIAKGSEDVYGKEVVCPVRFGINGGIGCGSDEKDLPVASPQTYLNFRAPIVNIFGNIEISDKVLRAAQNSAGSFVNILNSEMEGLISAAKFNFSRMLFQDGSGKLASLKGTQTSNTVLTVDSVKNLIEGMVIDVCKGESVKSTGHKIVLVDRINKTVKVEPALSDTTAGNGLYLQGSKGGEIFGLPYLYKTAAQETLIYGTPRALAPYLLPKTYTVNSLDSDTIQSILDTVEETSGTGINLILASYDMRRKYLSTLQATRTNVDYLNLDGGFKTISYNGIPIYADRFVEDNTMHFVNTDDFKLQQLGEWSWIEGEGGKILRQLDRKAAYGATLVKYANLICVRPIGQTKITYEAPTEPEQTNGGGGEQ